MTGIVHTAPRTEESDLEDRVLLKPSIQFRANYKQVAFIEVIL